jgi:glycine/D-amino acid oxidase-like deaminating enzyme
MCCRPSSPSRHQADSSTTVVHLRRRPLLRQAQSDKGGLVFGGDIDGYNSYAQRGNLPVVEDVCEGGMALMPGDRPAVKPAAELGRASWTCRWTARRSSTSTPVEGLYLNAGWCYGGFKATPAAG